MKLFICLLFLATMTACKKDGSSGKKMWLSKVYVNNLLAKEYIYSSDKKLIRRKVYNTAQGQSTYGGYTLYEYENGIVTEVLGYDKDDQLIARQKISYNASKKISRIDSYGADDELDYYHLFLYENDRLTKIDGYNASPVKKNTELFVKQDAKGNLLSSKRYYFISNNWVFNDSVTVVHADKPLPAYWDYYEMNAIDIIFDGVFLQMQAQSLSYYFAGGPPTQSTYTFSQKVYNPAGLLTSQHYKYEVDNGVTVNTKNDDLKYEYIE